MTDERYKELMTQIGMPNSKSLLQILEQVANETAQEQRQIADNNEKDFIGIFQNTAAQLVDEKIGDPL